MKLNYLISIGLMFVSVSFAENKQNYEQALERIVPGNIQVESVQDTPINGMKELTVNTGKSREIIYMSTDGQYIFNGNLFDIKNQIDLTAHKKNTIRLERLQTFSDAQRINYYPDKMQHKVTVFTDLDCPYCRQLHKQMPAYNELGIGVSYLFFPRSGLNTESSLKAVAAWCSDDRKKALDQAMAGQQLPELQCDNPIADHYNAGVSVGVSGTPALVLEDGTMLPGLVPPQQLKQRLDTLKKTSKP